METSLLLARIIGPYMLIAGLALLVNRASYQRMIEELRGQTLLLLIMGAFTLIIGLLMIQFHNIWTSDWRVLITLIGWITALKGTISMIAPDAMMRFAQGFNASSSASTKQAGLALLFGLFMSYMGYFA